MSAAVTWSVSPSEQSRSADWLRKGKRMDLHEVRVVRRVSRTSQISVYFVPARMAHGGVFAELLRIFQLTYGRVVSRNFLDLSGSEQIKSGVADMPYRNLITLDQCDGSHACHPGPLRVWDAASKISVLANANASWIRLSLAPVRRDSRAEMISTAISAARSPAACPPSPSTTRKMPRCASMKKRSSFSPRFRPASEWPPTSNCEVVIMV